MPMSPCTMETDGSEKTSRFMTSCSVAAVHKRKCSSFVRTYSGANNNKEV